MNEVLQNCKIDTIVAFKAKNDKIWLTGRIIWIYTPKCKYNHSDIYMLDIQIIDPCSVSRLNWYMNDISKIVILENGK